MRFFQHVWSGDGWDTEPLPLAGSEASRSLLLIFGDPHRFDVNLTREVASRSPGVAAVYCSSAGQIAHRAILDDRVVLTGLTLEQGRFRALVRTITDPDESENAGRLLGSDLAGVEGLRHVLLFSDGLSVRATMLVRGLEACLPAGVAITGGLASDGTRFAETVIGLDGQPLPGRVVAVGIHGDSRLQIRYASLGGWDPFGLVRRVTRSRGQIVYEFDDEPALDVYRRYLGEHSAGLPSSALFFPLAVRKDGERRVVVRTVVAIDESEGSLTFAADIPEGSTAQLMMANKDRLISGAENAAMVVMAGASGTPDFALLVSSVGRRRVLGQRTEEEVEAVSTILGSDVPLAGYYAYGEICPFEVGGAGEVQNQSMAVMTFREVSS